MTEGRGNFFCPRVARVQQQVKEMAYEESFCLSGGAARRLERRFRMVEAGAGRARRRLRVGGSGEIFRSARQRC